MLLICLIFLMFIFAPLLFYLSYVSSLDDVLDVLITRNPASTRRLFSEQPLQAEEITILIKRLSELPFTASLKTDAWYKLLGNRSVSDWNHNDWKIFQPIIPYLPLDLLVNVNFGNPEILKVFGEIELQKLQLSMVAELLLKKWGSQIFNREEKIIKMGNIFCGLPNYVLEGLDEFLIRSLLTKKFFKNIKTCSVDKLNILSKKAISFKVLGPLRTWTASSLEFAGSLIAGLSGDDIRKIRAQSFSGLTPEVIHLMPLSTLTRMRTRQLKELKKPTLLAWRRETKDLRPLYSRSEPRRISWTLCLVILLFAQTTML